MADSSDSSSNSSGSSIASSNASLKDLEAPDGNDSKPNKKQKFLLDFFKIKRKRRRPKKATTEKGKPKRGRPPSQPKIDPLLLASSNPSLPIGAHQAEDCTVLKAKKTRIKTRIKIGPIQVHSRNIAGLCLTHTFSRFEARNG
jgi:hypothetical protein